MKYRNLYLRELERQKEKAIEVGKPDGDFAEEWVVIAVAMKYPSYHPVEASKIIEKDFGIKMSTDETDRMQRKVNLAAPWKREQQSKTARHNASLFRKLISGDSSVADELKEILDNLADTYDDRGKKIFPAKYTLCYMLVYDKELWCNDECRIIVKNFKDPLCRKTLECIFKTIAGRMDVAIDVSSDGGASKSIESTIRQLKSKTEVLAEINEMESKDKKIELLTFNVRNLKSALELATDELSEIKDSIKDSTLAAQERTITDFYKGLNSKEYGSILDNLVYVEHVLAKYRRERMKFEGDLNSITVILKQVIRFIKSQNLSPIIPIKEIGKVIKVSEEDLFEYEYIGELFKDGETKEVEIVSPGWKYDENVISYPTIREKGM